MMKKIAGIILIFTIFISLSACGGNKQELTNENINVDVEAVSMVEDDADHNCIVEENVGIEEKDIVEEIGFEISEDDVMEEISSGISEDDVVEEIPSGINEDGIGEDPDFGEGIGEVIALSDEEREYVQKQTTNSWLEMTETEKDDLVVLIGRWLEESRNYIVEDYDELVAMLDHQMEQYYRNNVNESVFDTVIDILGVN